MSDEKPTHTVDGEIVTTENLPGAPLANVPGLLERDPDEVRALQQRVMKNQRELVQACLSVTHPGDWVDMGGNPYLEGAGCERMMTLLGIGFRKIVIDPTLKEAQYMARDGIYPIFQVTAECFATRLGDYYTTAIGTRSCEDEFFTTRWEGPPNKRVKRKREATAVELDDVMKAAVTNMHVHGVTELLGLRGLTWDTLKDYGITKGDKSITFRDQARKDDPPKDKEDLPKDKDTGPKGNKVADKAKQRREMIARIKSTLIERSAGQEPGALLFLKEQTAGTITTWAKLAEAPDKWLTKIAEKLNLK